jgi:serine/threonine-protein kinase HipA
MEDMAQIIGRSPTQLYSGRYEELAALVGALCPEDAGGFIDQLVFMIASGNGDAHLKNWSVLYPDRRNPRLSPAYDLVSTRLYNPRDGLALSLAGTKRFEELSWSSLDGLGQGLHWSQRALQERARAAWSRTLEVWEREQGQLPWTASERSCIDAHLAMLRSSFR